MLIYFYLGSCFLLREGVKDKASEHIGCWLCVHVLFPPTWPEACGLLLSGKEEDGQDWEGVEKVMGQGSTGVWCNSCSKV